MVRVLLALIPGFLLMAYSFGPGVIINVGLAMLFCTGFEAMMLGLTRKPLRVLTDGSALVTGALLGLALPPYLPVGYLLIGCLFAMVLAKHTYGGLGRNLFNPAMVGFAVLIVSFPLAMSTWPDPGHRLADPLLVFSVKLHNGDALPVLIDGISRATPLDEFKFRGALTVAEFWDQFGPENARAWLYINLGFLFGGLYLVYSGVCHWRAPTAMLFTLAALSLPGYDYGSSASTGTPFMHLFSGATMLGAFFIVTDPVTSPNSTSGQWVFGVGVGILTYVIRVTGAYPEGIAFAILLMNGASPLIDHIEFRLRPHPGHSA